LTCRAEHVLRGFDSEVRIHIQDEMIKRGIKIVAGIAPVAVEAASDAKRVRYGDGTVIETDVLLFATGRAPNTKALGLEAIGVALDKKGAIKVDEWQRTNVPSIYAVGDVTDRLNLTPVAIAEGRAIAETVFNDNPIKISHENVPTAVFSAPPIGTVGLSEEEAIVKFGKVDVYTTRFKPMKHTLSGRDERILMKLVVDSATDRVLGCHMVGPDAPEIIQGLAIALKCGATKKQFDATVGLHPSAAEEFVTMRDKRPDLTPKLATAAQ
jgi:glutathione reductase (NADPH)